MARFILCFPLNTFFLVGSCRYPINALTRLFNVMLNQQFLFLSSFFAQYPDNGCKSHSHWYTEKNNRFYKNT